MATTIEFPLPDGSIAAIDTRVQSTIISARPGLFVVDLLPLPGGGFDRTKFLKTPVLAWRLGGGWTYLHPVVAGADVTDGWSILLPDGLVMVDEYSFGGSDRPLRLQTWINLEIEWMKVAHHYMDPDDMKVFSSPRSAIFCYGGPIAKAIVTMVAWRTNEWIGTPERLRAELSAFRVRGDPQLPSDPFVLANTAISQAKEVLADVGIVVERIDGGRIRVGRRASPEQSFSIGSAVDTDK